MKYNPEIHRRRSIRLHGYDYSQAGCFFVTICVKDREWLFGKIENEEMALNDAGSMVKKWYCEIEKKFSDILCEEMVVMPNHVHFIIRNTGIGTSGPNVTNGTTGTYSWADMGTCPDPRVCQDGAEIQPEFGNTQGSLGDHTGSPLHRVVQWFKTMTTNEYIRGVKSMGWQPFNGKLWQRNYYEHIIRNEQSHKAIADYIVNNPTKWQEDQFYL